MTHPAQRTLPLAPTRADFVIGRLAPKRPPLDAQGAGVIQGPYRARLPASRLGHRVAWAASLVGLGFALAIVSGAA